MRAFDLATRRNVIANKYPDIAKAIRLHQSGKLEKAEKIYSRILKANPKSVNALHFLGLLHYQKGAAKSAIELVEKAIALDPEYADAHNNLGNMLRDRGDLDVAQASYQRALDIDPDQVEALSNVGVLHRVRGNLKESFKLLFRAVELAPDSAFAHFNLGSTLAAAKEVEGAMHHFRRAVALDHKLSATYLVLGRLMLSLGRQEEAVDMYEDLLRIAPDNAVAIHMHSAMTGKNVPEKASVAFVVETFDQFASGFEAQLSRLEYRGPELVKNALAAAVGKPSAALTVLDLGCGTGWCGRELRSFARTLVGVDLSSRMLDFARQSGCYDRLHCSELVVHMLKARKSYDAIVSADTLCYFGALEEVFEAVKARLNPEGLFILTVEKAGSDSGVPFELQSHGRYRHSIDYLESALVETSLVIVSAHTEILRKEFGEDVEGWVVTARPVENAGGQPANARSR